MTDDDAQKVIDRLKYTKKELERRKWEALKAEIGAILAQSIAAEIDNEILNTLKNNQSTWQTESTSPSDTKKADGLSTSLPLADSTLILSEEFITNQIITCPRVDYLKVSNSVPKGLTFSGKTIPISITNGAFIRLDMQTETFRSVLNPNQWFTVGTERILSSLATPEDSRLLKVSSSVTGQLCEDQKEMPSVRTSWSTSSTHSTGQ
jgi:hypothetical protein